ncbi:flagellar protein export ATPase FliI [Limnohabitans sp. DM1]|uniref:flagellar protein export ATPase FliI n=1 Tax=Limnohabitans sp. DM1 TaxID=1597955 RepID=UPI000AB58713|nr:flagellar protein export ATPase FliI [Limnohabitans sp. DM1]
MLEQVQQDWQSYFENAHARLKRGLHFESSGTLSRVSGLMLEAKGLRAPIGSQCHIEQAGLSSILAEVVGFSDEVALLMPAADINGLHSGCRVVLDRPSWPALRWGESPNSLEKKPQGGSNLLLPVGNGLLGRVLDPSGAPLDGLGPLDNVHRVSWSQAPVNAMAREPVRQTLDTGIRAINALLTVGRGQRLGLFAGSGVGKSVLLGMMARYTQADVIVVGLIGERGREVKEFIEDILGDEGRKRSVVVAAPADLPPLLRMQGASYATAIAEYFKAQGQHVLLLMDSLTRYAMAQREIALAVGELPATKGYPPSCFSKLPQLVERSGNGRNGEGSITAFYTVLSEGDDMQDPIADAARAILDGHIVLTRELAESGHFPAIDVLQSASRVMHNVTEMSHQKKANEFRSHLANFVRGRDLIQLGAYQHGSDASLDRAIALQEPMQAFLQQGMHECCTQDQSIAQLFEIFSSNLLHERPEDA